MRILNVMFSRGLGGIEQSFADYSRVLLGRGHEVISCIQPRASIYAALQQNIATLRNYGQWDLLAAWRLKKIEADIIIAHGNRAAVLARGARAPVVGVVHNYSFRRMIGLGALFTITSNLKEKVIAAGQPEHTVFHIPNMIELPSMPPKPRDFRSPPIIGAMGRFVKKKGFDSFIRALAILKNKGMDFRAVIAGDGEEKAALEALSNASGLKNHIIFPGWISDKTAFFNSIDLFCLPSLHEPFGIVLLEAMTHGVPVITTDSEGPSEIVTHNKDALIVPRNNPTSVAEAIAALLSESKAAKQLAHNAWKTVQQYSPDVIGARIEQALEAVLKQH